MSQKSYEDEPGFLSSPSFLEEEDPGPLSQQLQATSSRGNEPFSSLDLSQRSLGNLEYLPFFRTYGQLLVEELAPQPDVGCEGAANGKESVQEGVWSTREAPSREDSEPPSGFSPYYRSEEESFLNLSWGRSQDPASRMESQAGCSCRRTGGSGSAAASGGPDLISWVLLNRWPILTASAGHPCDSSLDTSLSSDAAVSGHAPQASGFVPYYRTPEEGLHTSPGPPAPPSGARSPQGSCPSLVWPHLEEAEGGSSESHQGTGPQPPRVTEGGGAGLRAPELSRPWVCRGAHSLQSCQEVPRPWRALPAPPRALSWPGEETPRPASVRLQAGVWLSRPGVGLPPQGTEGSSRPYPQEVAPLSWAAD